MLHALCRQNQTGVAHRVVLRIFDHGFAAVDQRCHCLALVGARRLLRFCQQILDTCGVLTGLLQMGGEGLFQLWIGRCVRHLRQRLGQLRFHRIHCVQLLVVKCAQVFEIC